jgi:hypothetical protein
MDFSAEINDPISLQLPVCVSWVDEAAIGSVTVMVFGATVSAIMTQSV